MDIRHEDRPFRLFQPLHVISSINRFEIGGSPVSESPSISWIVKNSKRLGMSKVNPRLTHLKPSCFKSDKMPIFTMEECNDGHPSIEKKVERIS